MPLDGVIKRTSLLAKKSSKSSLTSSGSFGGAAEPLNPSYVKSELDHARALLKAKADALAAAEAERDALKGTLEALRAERDELEVSRDAAVREARGERVRLEGAQTERQAAERELRAAREELGRLQGWVHIHERAESEREKERERVVSLEAVHMEVETIRRSCTAQLELLEMLRRRGDTHEAENRAAHETLQRLVQGVAGSKADAPVLSPDPAAVQQVVARLEEATARLVSACASIEDDRSPRHDPEADAELHEKVLEELMVLKDAIAKVREQQAAPVKAEEASAEGRQLVSSSTSPSSAKVVANGTPRHSKDDKKVTISRRSLTLIGMMVMSMMLVLLAGARLSLAYTDWRSQACWLAANRPPL